jgi:hypothetical protein
VKWTLTNHNLDENAFQFCFATHPEINADVPTNYIRILVNIAKLRFFLEKGSISPDSINLPSESVKNVRVVGFNFRPIAALLVFKYHTRYDFTDIVYANKYKMRSENFILICYIHIPTKVSAQF